MNDIRLINYCHKCGYDRWNGQDFNTFSGKIECIACGNMLEVSKGWVVLPENQCIAKEKKFLREALEKEDFTALKNRAMNIISIKPHDLKANFYEKLAEKKLCSDSYSNSYGDFLCLPLDGTDDDYSVILEWALKYYNPREEYQICAFISKLKSLELQKKWRDTWRNAFRITLNDFVNLEKTKDETGNTPGNIMNCGYVALKDGWLYYGNPSDGYKLYKSKIDNDGKFCESEKLCDDICRFINIAAGFVYYINISDGFLYRIGIDGDKSSKIKLSEDKLNFVNVVGQWIYCSNEYHEGRLYKIPIDGKTKILLDEHNHDKCEYINVDGDWIYYRSAGDGGKLCRVHKNENDQKGRVTISDDDCIHINVADDYIYYINASDNYRIYKIRKDCKARKEQLNGAKNDICRSINVVGEWIYYTADVDKCRLYRIRTTGDINSRSLVGSNDKCRHINVVGNWVYYRNRSDDNKLYKIKIDGKSREEA